MVTSQDIVDVVNSSRSHSDLGEISWPGTSVGVFGSILGHIWRVDSIVNVSVSLIPFLVVVLLEVVMSWTDGEHTDHIGELELSISFIKKGIVLLLHNTVTVCAVSGEDLETSSDTTGIVGTPESELRPVEMAVVSTNFGNLFFVTLDTPESTNIVSKDPSLCCGISVPGKVA